MGSSKKAATVAGVCLAMVLSFALAMGFGPSQPGDASAGAIAATGAASVQISADGAAALGDAITLSVGESVGLTALSVSGGQAAGVLSSAEVDWSLASDGAASLSVGDLAATLTGVTPGEAGVFVSTPDGGVDLLDVTVVDESTAKVLSSVDITNPENGTTIFVEQNATGIPLTMTSQVNDPADTFGVRYTFDGSQMADAFTPPFAATIPDVTNLTVFSIEAAAASYAEYSQSGTPNFNISDSVTFSLTQGAFDNDGNGLPDNPFALNLGPNDSYVNVVEINGVKKVVVVKPLAGSAKGNLPAGGTTISASDPDDASRTVAATFPAGLVGDGETGLAILEIADDLETLVGAQPGDDILALPGDGIVDGALFAEVSALISTDGGATFSELDNARLVDNPVEIVATGTANVATDNVNFFSFPTSVTVAPVSITAQDPGTWNQVDGGTNAGNGTVATETTSLSVFAPFSTPTALNIASIQNAGATSLAGTPQDFATGGSPIEITVANATGANLGIEIDGVDLTASASQMSSNGLEIITVNAPPAMTQSDITASLGVDVRVTNLVNGGTEFDVVPDGLVYRAPIINNITPIVGSGSGGDAVVITGEGFEPGVTVTLGDSPLSAVSVTGSTQIDGTTTAADPGLVDLAVTLSNNFQGTLANAFTFTPPTPVITSAIPNTVYNDGGYQVRVEGTDFLDPDTVFTATKGASATYDVYADAFFTVQQDVQNSGADQRSPAVRFLDDSRLSVLTPARTATGMYNIYVASVVYQTYNNNLKQLDDFFATSNLLPFEFLDLADAPFSIDTISPDTGPKSGGTNVGITGTGFPVAKEVKVESKGVDAFGHQIRLGNQAALNGEQIEIGMYYVRGTDVPADEAPATLNFRFTYDPTILEPVLVGGSPFAQASDNLDFFYSKGIDAGMPSSGVISIVVSGGTTEITTCDDQIPLAGHDPNNCQNPFRLGTVVFNVIGDTDAITPLTVSDVSMADATPQQLPNTSAQDGQFCVAAEPCQIVEPSADVNVFFGPNQAQIAGATTKGGDQVTVDVTAPAAFDTSDDLFNDNDLFGMDGFGVDVRVEDANDSSLFAISKGMSVYNPTPTEGNRGFIYLNEVPPQIDDVSPDTSWIFGGQNVTITGVGFAGEQSTVTFNGQVAEFTPGRTQSGTELNVIPPPLSDDSTDARVTVDVTVENPAVAKQLAGSDTAEGAFTYVKWDGRTESVPEKTGLDPAIAGGLDEILRLDAKQTTGNVAVNAFFFDPAVGGTFDLVLDQNAKQNTDTINTGPGSITIPALTDKGGLAGTVFGIVRASKDPVVTNADNLTSAQFDVGTAIENIWNFDLHLYDGQYPFSELAGISFNTDETPATVSFPTDDAFLPLSEVEEGGVANWSTLGGTYDFTFGMSSFMPTDNSAQFQSLVTLDKLDTAKGDQTFVTALNQVELFDLSQSSFAVITDAAPPADNVFGELNPEVANEGPVGGGTEIELTGGNIGWTTQVLFVANGKQEQATAVPTNRGENANSIRVITPPSPDGQTGPVDIFLEVPTNQGAKGVATTLVPVAGDFTYLSARRLPIGAIASLLALIGLIAGGIGGDGGDGGPCFIATAAYGTPMAEQVDTLRTVRDSFLLNNAVGSTFVDAYYRMSPALADTVAKSPALAAGVRVMLLPLVGLGKLVLNAPMLSLALASIAFLLWKARRRFSAMKA